SACGDGRDSKKPSERTQHLLLPDKTEGVTINCLIIIKKTIYLIDPLNSQIIFLIFFCGLARTH
ncbi:MAG: hypothetical protein MPJ79_07180, partial [Alphaproteobacteria bacterium]|nr:hypothetical protein [Alphaproteobacteria bacterium]